MFNYIEDEKIRKNQMMDELSEELEELKSKYHIVDNSREQSCIAKYLQMANSTLMEIHETMCKTNRFKLEKVSTLNEKMFFLYTYLMNVFFRVTMAISFMDSEAPKGYVNKKFIL